MNVMSNKLKQSFVAIILVFICIISACDYVKDANEPSSATITGSTTSTTNSSAVYRKVLVEDYTGHKCGNCPLAAEELKRIDSVYHGNIVPIAVHAGFFAGTNAQYPTDYKTTEGTAYDNTFGVSAIGNPNGLVNRRGFGQPSFVKAWTLWAGEVVDMDTMLAAFKIDISNNFNTSTNKLDCEVKVKALKNLNGNYYLTVLITEDSLISTQLDYSKPVGQQVIPNYKFMHVLRGSLNGTWGEQVMNGSISINTEVIKNYTNFTINSGYNPDKCHIVAFVYDADAASPTYYEVFQAEDEELK
jgi:hypothetical protein